MSKATEPVTGRRLYEHRDPVDFLRDLYAAKQQLNPRFSLRAWARQLGLSSHVPLSLVLTGKRRLTPRLAQQISGKLGLSLLQCRYFELLTLFQTAGTPAEKNLFQDALEELYPNFESHLLDQDRLRALGDAQHIAVLEAVNLRDFKEAPSWMAERLGLSPSQGEAIIKRLLRVGLLERRSGKLFQPHAQRRSPDDVPSALVRAVQAQGLEDARRALEKQSIDEREFATLTFAVRKSDLPAAKKSLRDFRRQFLRRFEAKPGDELYQLALQFFRLTSKKGETPNET